MQYYSIAIIGVIMMCHLIPITGLTCRSGWKKAALTTYTSYPECCSNPDADQTECEDFSGCDYQGDFAYIGHQSKSWVKRNSVCAFFTTRGDMWKYQNKKIRISKYGKTVVCNVYDTCGDDDCDGCCTENAGSSGFLIDMEYWTVMRNYGDINKADGEACFQVV